MLMPRMITAIVLITLCLGVLFYLPPIYFVAGMLIVSILAFCEWTNLMSVKTTLGRCLYLIIAVAVFVNSIYIPTNIIVIAASIWWCIAAFLVFLYPRFSSFFAKNTIIRGIIGFIVIIPCFRAMSYLRTLEDGPLVVLYLFILIWGADTAAFFAGRRFGKTKFVPLVSPNKSVEGVVAALASSALVTVLILMKLHKLESMWLSMLALAIITTFFSIIGDLFESLLKRQVGIKDSGKLLPGHGGLLDRIDSLTAASTVFAVGTMILAR